MRHDFQIFLIFMSEETNIVTFLFLIYLFFGMLYVRGTNKRAIWVLLTLERKFKSMYSKELERFFKDQKPIEKKLPNISLISHSQKRQNVPSSNGQGVKSYQIHEGIMEQGFLSRESQKAVWTSPRDLKAWKGQCGRRCAPSFRQSGWANARISISRKGIIQGNTISPPLKARS